MFDGGSLMAVDPGGSVGVAIAPWSVLEDLDWSKVETFEITDANVPSHGWDLNTEKVYEMLTLMVRYRVRALTVERWQHRPGSVLKGDALAAPLQEGMIHFALDMKWFHGPIGSGVLSWQLPSAAKAVVTDARLKSLGLWVAGSAHKRDANRHLALFVRRIRKGEVKLPW